MVEEKSEVKTEKNSFPFYSIFKLLFAIYLIIVGLGVSIPYLNKIQFNILFFISAAIIFFSLKPNEDVKRFKKSLAKELKK